MVERASVVHVIPAKICFTDLDRLMRNYRVLELRPDGHVTNKFDFSARDDDAAKVQALEATFGQDMELWRNDRKISEWRGQRPSWLKVRRMSKGG